MGNIFSLDDTVIQTAQDAIDDLMANHDVGGLGKTCRLVYPPKMTRCPNCVYDPSARRSGNTWINGGPMPFQTGQICPMCNGQGYQATEVTDTITMLVSWEPSKWWVKLPPNIQYATGMVQTKGHLTDVPKILQARKMVLESPIEGIMRYSFVLEGEPIDPGNIVQGRYFIAFWKRAG